MKVSIITTCYNRESTIRDTIESVLNQSYFDIEYIIVDGASKDKSLDIINEYRDHIKIIISESDNGMYEAINKGLKKATGDIIGLVHSDDILYTKNTIQHIVDEFNETNADLIYGNGIYVDENNIRKIVRNWISGPYKQNKIAHGWLPLHPTVYITKETLNKCGFYDEKYKIASDSDWIIRYMYDNQLNIHYLNEYIICMRMGGLSTDPKKIKKKWTEDLQIYHSHGINAYLALGGKIISKIPQFISAKFLNTNYMQI